MGRKLIAEFEIKSNGVIQDRFWDLDPDHVEVTIGNPSSISITWPCDIRTRKFSSVGKYQAFENENGGVEVIYTAPTETTTTPPTEETASEKNITSRIGCLDFGNLLETSITRYEMTHLPWPKDGSQCKKCKATVKIPFTCPKCHVWPYCNESCMQSDQSVHKSHCRELWVTWKVPSVFSK